MLTLCYVLRGSNGYPMGMDIHRVWTWTQFFARGYFHERAKIVFMDMDMDLMLFNPIQTRPIAILIQAGPQLPWQSRRHSLQLLELCRINPDVFIQEEVVHRDQIDGEGGPEVSA